MGRGRVGVHGSGLAERGPFRYLKIADRWPIRMRNRPTNFRRWHGRVLGDRYSQRGFWAGEVLPLAYSAAGAYIADGGLAKEAHIGAHLTGGPGVLADLMMV
jgi:hypothetical protein